MSCESLVSIFAASESKLGSFGSRHRRSRSRKSFLIILICWRSMTWVTGAFQVKNAMPRSVCRASASRVWSVPVPDPDSDRLQDVSFLSPLLEYGYLPAVEEHEEGSLGQKPMLLILPGFDGTFLSSFLQFPELHTIFDVRCMTVGAQDRSTFDELKKGVINFLLSELGEEDRNQERQASSATESSKEQQDKALVSSQSFSKGNVITNLFSGLSSSSTTVKPRLSSRPVYLLGESFGGILAPEVALSLLDGTEDSNVQLKGMVLVNAATCYDRSRLGAEGPAVAELPQWLYPAGLLKLLPLFMDEHSMDQLLLMQQAKALPSVIDDETREAYLGRVAMSLPFVLKYIPQDTFKWRLTAWLETGCNRMAVKLADFRRHSSFRTLIVAAEFDGALPSIAEAERLASMFTNPVVHVVEGAGHASTCGSRVDLAALFRCHFRELGRSGRWQRSSSPRTAMKEVAAAGKGEYFGMEPRYDGKSFGLNPLKYWSRKYYRKAQPTVRKRVSE